MSVGNADEAEEFEGYTKTVRGIAFDVSHCMDEDGGTRISLKVLLVKNKGELYRKDKNYERVSGLTGAEKLRSGKPAGWGCPSGGVEYRETLDGAMEREGSGESGFHLRRDRPLTMFPDPAAVKRNISNIIYGFLYEADDLRIPIKESHEIEKSEWFEIEEVLRLPIVDPAHNNNPENAIYYSHKDFIIRVMHLLACFDLLRSGRFEISEKWQKWLNGLSPEFKRWLQRNQPLIAEKYVELVLAGKIKLDDEAVQDLADCGLIEFGAEDTEETA